MQIGVRPKPTVSATDTSVGAVGVNVTDPIANGLFAATDTFDVGLQTIVLGSSGSMLFGSLGRVSSGDVSLTRPSSSSTALKLLRHEQAKHGHHEKQ